MQPLSTEELVHLIRSKVIPWTFPGARSGFFVARDKARSLVLPENVTVTRRKLVGRRVVVRNKRKFGNLRNFVADWPDDNLQEMTGPKLVCITDNIADYLLGDYCAHCPAGTFFLMPPLLPHQCKAPNLQGERRKNGACTLLHAYAYRNGIHFWYSYSINDRHINNPANNYLIPKTTAVQILLSLAREAEEERPDFNTVANGLTAAFFAVIARELEAGNYMHTGPAKRVPLQVQTESFAEQVRAYINGNCHRMLRMDDVAREMYMSRSQFAYRMKHEVGMTFLELLNNARIERACQMLCETDHTFTGITFCLGFRSPSHFQSLFRARMGCTPMEYRRKNVLSEN